MTTMSGKSPINFVLCQEREHCHLFPLYAFWMKRKYSVSLHKSLKQFLKTCLSSLYREKDSLLLTLLLMWLKIRS